MVFEEKRVALKAGIACILRSPGPDDAEAVLAHLRQTSEETNFMIRYPEEIILTVKEEEEFLEKYQTDQKSMMISAVIDGKIIANAGLSCVMDTIKYRHRAVFGISIQKEYWNMGIGTAILSELIRWAPNAGYEQLELEVACENERAVRLYKKMGFEIYGTRECSCKYRDETYSSDYLMLRSLRPAG
ncbi:MAG TPA: GNAT family N-acetyltransferase [Anaerovoracaceae bacterium]|nr:GNAT family N-acetyltransferase [Anaerovoracaceae bacterium]